MSAYDDLWRESMEKIRDEARRQHAPRYAAWLDRAEALGKRLDGGGVVSAAHPPKPPEGEREKADAAFLRGLGIAP